MEERVHVEQEALDLLNNAFSTAGENYKAYYNKLTNLINEITERHIQGDVAVEFLNKFEEKKASFERVYEIIDLTQKYTSSRTEQFIGDMDSLMNKYMG